MSIEVQCERCRKVLKIKDSLAGSRGLCPFCKNPIEVPRAVSSDYVTTVTNVSSPPEIVPSLPIRPSPSPVSVLTNGGESTIYSDVGVKVTTARVICQGTTYALRNITSVKMGVTPANPHAGNLMLVLGGLMCLGGIASIGNDASGLGGVPFGIGLAVWGYYKRKNATADYHLAIAVSSGEVQAFTSKDRRQVEQIVAAVNEAIIRCR